MRLRWIALLVMLLFAGAIASAEAASTVFWTGANAFDDQTISFSPFVADRLTSISGTGFSDNGVAVGVVFQLSIVLNGTAFTLDTWSQTAGHHLLSERTATGPLIFDAGVVSALRLQSSAPVTNAFKEFSEMYKGNDRTDLPTRFTFERVPEPGTLILLGSGFAALAAFARRRRR